MVATILSDAERVIIHRWICEQVSAAVVPSDDNDEDALRYNLLSLLHGVGSYHGWIWEDPDAVAQLAAWEAGYAPIRET